MASLPLCAQEVDSSRQVNVSGEATVVAWKNRSPLKGSTAGRVSWDMKQLQTLPQILGNADPLRYLQSLPTVQTSSELDAGLHIQGCDMGQSVFLLGNAPVFNPSHLLGLFSTFNSNHYESLNFTTMAVAGQPNRLGGLVQMVPFAQNDTVEQRKGILERAELNVGPMSSQGTVRLRPSGNLRLVLSARQAYMNLLYGRWLDFDGSPLRYSFGDYNATLSYRPSAVHRFDFNAYFGQDCMAYTEGAHLMHMRLNWSNYAAEMSWKLMRDKWRLTQRLIASGYQNKFCLDQAEQKMRLPSHIRQYGYQADWEKNAWQAGVNYTLYQIRPQSPQIESSYAHVESESYGSRNAHEANLYASWKKGWHDERWQLKPECRLSYYHTIDRHAYFSASPMLSLMWQPTPRQRWTLQASRTYQYIHQLGFTSLGLPTEFWFSSTQKINPQSAEGVSLLYDAALGGNAWRLAANAYVKHLHGQKEYKDNVLDLINDTYSLEQALLQGTGVNYGFGLQLTRQTGPLTGWVGYALGRSLRHFNVWGRPGTYPARYERVHEINLLATWQLQKRIALSCSAVFASGTPFTSAQGFYMMNGYVMAQYGSYNACHLPWYKRVDLAANFNFKQKGKRRFKQGVNVSLFNAFGFNNLLFYRLHMRKDETFRFAPVSVMKFPLPSFSYYLKF